MIRKILDWLRGRRNEWSAAPGETKMRRWDGDRWVYRDMTDDEVEDAAWWNGIR